MHRSHDREALNESKVEPEPALGSGSPRFPDPEVEDVHLALRQRQHDAANWMAVLRGHLDLLAHDPDAAPSLRSEWLDRARSAASAAERLLRGAGEADIGGGIHSPLSVVLQELAGHAHAIIPGYARLELDLDLPQAQRSCVLSDDDLEDVLLNLLRNAGQSLDERGGTITLRAREHEAGELVIEVQDDGSGMSPEVRDRCLTPGFSTRPGSGRGLGLSRVHSIVRDAKGRIEIDTELGKGTCVRLVLVSFEGSSEAAGISAPRASGIPGPAPLAGIPGGVPRVLVIDDDEGVSGVLTALLERLGGHAVAARDGAAARARLRELQYDLVLVDRELPDIEGDELAREIRRGDPTLSIVLLTGDPAGAAGGAEFDDALIKPVGLDRLRRLLEDTLPITRRRRAKVENA